MLFLVVLTYMASIMDIVKKKIPNEIVFSGMAIGAFLSWLQGELLNRIWGIGILFIFAYLIYRYFRNKVGLGDIKLWMMCTSFTGFIPSLYIFTVSQILLFINALICGKKSQMTSGLRQYAVYGTLPEGTEEYPFAPFFLIAVSLYILWKILRVLLV